MTSHVLIASLSKLKYLIKILSITSSQAVITKNGIITIIRISIVNHRLTILNKYKIYKNFYMSSKFDLSIINILEYI